MRNHFEAINHELREQNYNFRCYVRWLLLLVKSQTGKFDQDDGEPVKCQDRNYMSGCTVNYRYFAIVEQKTKACSEKLSMLMFQKNGSLFALISSSAIVFKFKGNSKEYCILGRRANLKNATSYK